MIKKLLIGTSITTVVIISAVVGFKFYADKKIAVTTETAVYECVENYSPVLEEVEIQELTRVVSEEVVGILGETNTKELTEENIEQLMVAVTEKLETTQYSIPEYEIDRLAGLVVERVLTETSGDAAKVAELVSKVNNVANRLNNLEKKNGGITKEEMQSYISSNMITREELNNIITTECSETIIIQKLAKFCNKTPEEFYKILVESQSYKDDVYAKLESELKISKESVQQSVNKSNSLESIVKDLKNKTHLSESQVETIVKKHLGVNEGRISDLAIQLAKDKSELKTYMDVAKAETDKAIKDIVNDMAKMSFDVSSMSNETITQLATKLGVSQTQIESVVLSSTTVIQNNLEQLRQDVTNNYMSKTDADNSYVSKSDIATTVDGIVVASIEEALSDLGGRYQTIEEALAQKQALETAQSTLSTKVNTNKTNITDLTNQLQTARTSMTTMKAELEAANQAVADALEAEEADRVAAVQTAIDRIIAAEGAVEDLDEAQAAALERAKTDLQSALEASAGEQEGKLAAAQSLLEASITNADGKITDLTTQLQTAQGNISTNAQNIEALTLAQTAIDAALQAETGDREAAVQAAIDRIAAAEQSLTDKDTAQSAALTAAKAELQAALEASAGEQEGKLTAAQDALSTSIAAVSGDLTALTGTVGAVSGDLSNLTGTVTSVQGDVATNAQSISDLNTSLDEKYNENKDAIDELGSSKAEITYSVENGVPTLRISSVQTN